MQTINPPLSEIELLQRAKAIAGMNVRQVAKLCGLACPASQQYAKGWVGQLLEIILGATAATLSEPDFQYLGIELKTIPVNKQGVPKESTYICTVPMLGMGLFSESSVYKKLQRVLWVPIEAEPLIPLPERRIGNPLLWSPNEMQQRYLQQDWEELAEFLNLGNIETLNARIGRYLQIRPKAAHARERCKGIGVEGTIVQTLPRGFYLRANFTKQILQQHYLLSTSS
jgi:DNA mismatch repair protein MutH